MLHSISCYSREYFLATKFQVGERQLWAPFLCKKSFCTSMILLAYWTTFWLSGSKLAKKKGMLDCSLTRYETEVVEEGACRSTCYPEMACDGGTIYLTSPVGVIQVYSSAVRWAYYLINYVMITILTMWCTIIDTVVHVWGMILCGIM